MNSARILGLSVVLMTLVARPASAVPILQIYLEGGTYNTQTESWELTQPGTSGGGAFRLWVIGNVAGPGGKGLIEDVRLSVAYAQEHLGLTIDIESSTTGGYGEFFDPSISDAASQNIIVNTSKGAFDTTATGGVVTNGSTPVLGDGSNLPAHGIYGDGTVWQEYALGDFALTDSPIADFIGGFPIAPLVAKGQISVYEISVLGGSGATLHFDVYDHIGGDNHAKYKFAPFSHDGDGESNIVPEPVSCVMWGGLGIAALLVAWRKQRKLAA